MKKINWKFAIKGVGVVCCIVIFIVLALVIYYNKLEPLPMDLALRDFCYSIRGEKYGFGFWFFRLITEFGNFYVIGIIVIVAIVMTKCDYKSILLSIGVLLAVLLNVGLKGLYMRERPVEANRWMEELTTSFPSGHSTAAAFIYTFLIYIVFHTDLKRWIKNTLYVACGSIIILVMLSRMVLGVHYFSDVLAGASVGIMVSCLMMQMFKICLKYNFMTEGLFDKIASSRSKSNKE